MCWLGTKVHPPWGDFALYGKRTGKETGLPEKKTTPNFHPCDRVLNTKSDPRRDLNPQPLNVVFYPLQCRAPIRIVLMAFIFSTWVVTEQGTQWPLCFETSYRRRRPSICCCLFRDLVVCLDIMSLSPCFFTSLLQSTDHADVTWHITFHLIGRHSSSSFVLNDSRWLPLVN